MPVTRVNPRARSAAAAVLPVWLDAKADSVRAWVPGRVLACQICRTRNLVWGEFQRDAPGAPRVAGRAFCRRHLPRDWYTGQEGPSLFDRTPLRRGAERGDTDAAEM